MFGRFLQGINVASLMCLRSLELSHILNCNVWRTHTAMPVLVLCLLVLSKYTQAIESKVVDEQETSMKMSLTKDFDTSQLSVLSVSPNTLFGDFRQSKLLSDFGISVKSEGRFEFLNGEKIHWITIKPIENKISISATQIVSQQNDQAVMQLNADENPVVAILSEVFLSVLTAQWHQLDKYFDIQGRVVGDDWFLLLTPTDESFQQVFTHIETEGSQYIQSLRLFEQNGDKTTIRFQNIGTERIAFDSSSQNLFDNSGDKQSSTSRGEIAK